MTDVLADLSSFVAQCDAARLNDSDKQHYSNCHRQFVAWLYEVMSDIPKRLGNEGKPLLLKLVEMAFIRDEEVFEPYISMWKYVGTMSPEQKASILVCFRVAALMFDRHYL